MKTKVKPTKLTPEQRARIAAKMKARWAARAAGKPASSKASKPSKGMGSADASTKEKPAPAVKAITISREERELPHGAIVRSPENRTVTTETLDPDFVESLRKWGVLERVWVYPLAADDKRRKGGANYEIIAGEQRWCGAGVVGLKLLPVVIFHCTVEQADELRIIENLHRKNLTEIEEGRGYLRLMEKHGHVVRDDAHPERSLHHILNKSESYIYGLIKLVQASKTVQDAVQNGILGGSIALRVARISDPKSQAAAVQEFSNYERYHGGAITDKAAAAIIEERYQRQLKGAPFDTKDATLVPVELDAHKQRVAGGDCGSCPMRSGNQPQELIGDGSKNRGDMCLNPACYARKDAASWERDCSKHKGTHVTLSEEDSRAIFTGWGGGRADDIIGQNSRYIFPSDNCPEDPKKRTYAELIGSPHPASVTRFLIRSHRTGKAHTLLLHAECKAAIVAGGQHAFYEKQTEKKRAENSDTLIDLRNHAMFREAVEWRLAYLIDQLTTDPAGFSLAAFPFIVQALQAHSNDSPTLVPAVLSRWTPLKGGVCGNETAPAFIGTLDSNGAAAFVAEIALRRFIDYGTHRQLDEVITEIAKACSIDVADAWSRYTGRLVQLRKANVELSVAADFDLLKEIKAARSLDRVAAGRPVLTFTFHDRTFTNLAVEESDRAGCWEMVPVKAYDGKTHFYSKDDFGNEGLIVKQQGIEYALCGPRRHFFQRKEQCGKCGVVQDFTGKAPLTWANDEHTLCSKCDPLGHKTSKPAAGEHDWKKDCLVTQAGGFDLYKCAKCGAKAKRHGVQWPPTPDKGAKVECEVKI